MRYTKWIIKWICYQYAPLMVALADIYIYIVVNGLSWITTNQLIVIKMCL